MTARHVFRSSYLFAILISATSSLSPTAAVNFTWTGNAPTSNWDDPTFPTNWTGGPFGAIPGLGDTVVFDSSSTGPIFVSLNGTRTVTSATLQGSSSILISPSFNTLQLSSGNLTATAGGIGYTISSGITPLSTGLWNITQSGAAPGLTVSGVISGTAGFNKVGTGTLLLTGNNTNTGTTTVSSGVVQIGSGGTSGTFNGNLVNNATVTFDRVGTVTYNRVMSGNGALNKEGGGTLILTGNNALTGTTTVSSGILQIGSGGSTGSLPGDIVNSANVTFNRSSPLTYAGSISGTGSLSKQGSGTLTLTGNNTYNGTTTISSGFLEVGNGGTTGSILGTTLISSSSGLIFNRSNSHAHFGNISGSGSVTKRGTGTLAMTGSNSYFGDTILEDGVLSISSDNNLGSSNGTVHANGGALRVTGSHSTTRDFLLDAPLEIEVTGGTYTVAGLLAGSSPLTKSGGGTLIITGNNGAVNNKIISAGTLQVGNGGTSGTLTGNVLNNATIAFNRSDDLFYNGVISGNGSLIKDGPNRLTLTGTSSYTGSTTITNGILEIAADSNIGSGGPVNLSTAALNVTATHNTSRNFSLTGDAEFDIDTSVTYAINGQIGSVGSLTKNGGGTLALSGTNPYTGGTTVADGTLTLDTLSAVGTGPLNVQSSDLDVSGAAYVGVAGPATPDTVTIGNGGVLSTGIGEDTTIGFSGNVMLDNGTINARRLNAMFGGQLSGSGSVEAAVLADLGSSITATGDLELGNASAVNGFFSNGDLIVQSGTTTLRDANTATFDSAALVTLGDGVGSSGTLAVPNGITLDFGGNITGVGTVNTPNSAATPLINNGSITGSDPNAPITLTGYVKGVGTLDNVVITGTDAPGFSPAAVVRGSVTYDGTLEIEVGGTTPGSDYDQLNHILGAGIADLGGMLDVSLTAGFMPSAGDTFEIITANDLTGTFATVNLPPLSGFLNWDVNYDTANDLFALSVVTPFTADFDADGDVDNADLDIWESAYGATNLADADDDGDSDGLDFFAWQQQYTGDLGSPLAAPQAVPEPSGALSCFVALACGTLLLRPQRSERSFSCVFSR